VSWNPPVSRTEGKLGGFVSLRIVMTARRKTDPMSLDIEAQSGSAQGVVIGRLAPVIC
jgi:hypothetical protein